MKPLLALVLFWAATLAPAATPSDCPCEPDERAAQTEESARCVGRQLLQVLRDSNVEDHGELADRLEVAMEGDFIAGFVGAWSVSEGGEELSYSIALYDRFRRWVTVGVSCTEGQFVVEDAVVEHHAWAARESASQL
jgi:hypothetical protein